MKRIDTDTAYLAMAIALSTRSTCLDKQVGCVITNKKNEIIATGYNGAPRGVVHCIDTGVCLKEKSGNPNDCPSAHAEQNALIQCRVPEQIYTVYTTLSPCISCIRMLMNTPCQRIVFNNEHKHDEPKRLWKGGWIKHGNKGIILAD